MSKSEKKETAPTELAMFSREELRECFRRWKDAFEADPERFEEMQGSENYADDCVEYLLELRDTIRAENESS